MTFNEYVEGKVYLMNSLGRLFDLYNGEGNDRSYFRLKDIVIHQPENDYSDCLVKQIPYCYHIDLIVECYKGPDKGWNRTYTIEVPKMCEHGFLITDQDHNKLKFRSPILIGEFNQKIIYRGKKSKENRYIGIGNYIHIYIDPIEDDYPTISVKIDDKESPFVKYPLVGYLRHYGIKSSEIPKELNPKFPKLAKGEYALISLPEGEVNYYNNKILQLTKKDNKLTEENPYLTASIILDLVKLAINSPLTFEPFTPFDISFMDFSKALFDVDLQRQKSIKRKLISQIIRDGDIGASITKHIYAAFNMQTESGSVQVASTSNALSFLSQSKKIYFKRYRSTDKSPVIYTKDYYGIICPSKTPEGVDITSVKNEIATDVNFDENHNILISVISKESFLSGDMSSIEIPYEKYYKSRILSIDNIDYRIKKVIPIDGKVKIFHLGEFTEIPYKNNDCFDYIRKSPEGALAYNTGLIPFANKCDGTRLAMATSMLDQAIPILGARRSIVKTAINKLVFDKSNFNIKSPISGTVVRIVDGYITIQLEDKSYRTFSVPDVINTGMHTSNRFIPYVNLGDKIKSGDVLFISDSFKDNELALTVPLRVAYYSYGMLNSEDAIVISESASKLLSHKVTQHVRINVPSGTLALFDKDSVTEALKYNGRYNFYSKRLKLLNKFGLPEIGVEYSNLRHECLALYQAADISENSPRGKLALISGRKSKRLANQLYSVMMNNIPHEFSEGVVEDIRLFYRDDPEVKSRYAEVIEYYDKLHQQKLDEITGGLNTDVPDYKLNLDNDNVDLSIVISISNINECGMMSKITTRYASKGTVSDVIPDDEMPRINDEDGLPIQIMIPPQSTINRKNISQIYEMNLCLMCKIAFDLNTKYIKSNKFEKVKEVLNKLYVTEKFNNYSKENLIEFHNSFQDYYSVEVNSIDEIYNQKVMSNLCSYFDIDQDGYYLYDPKESERLTIQKVTVGITEIMRLHFLPEVKAKATSDILDTENIVLFGGDIRSGGQKIGEMERWQITAHGIETPLNNLMTKSGQLTLDENTNILLLNEARVAGIEYELYKDLGKI